MHASQHRPLRGHPRRFVPLTGRGSGWLLALLLLTAAIASASPMQPAHADLKGARAALQAGEWAKAEQELKTVPAAERGPAALLLAEVCFLTGRYAEAGAAAQKAAALPPQKSEGLRWQGEAQYETGKLAEAKQSLTAAVRADPKNTRARLALALYQKNTGQPAAMQATLQVFLDDYSAGVFDRAGAPALTDLAAGAALLELWQDANDVFRQATEKDPAYLRAHLEWGDLFLKKYQPGEAQKSYEAVLKLNPRHPRALLGMARVALTGKYDVKGATEAADRALAQNPKLAGALEVKAGLFLDNEEYGPAEALLREALATNPARLESLTLLGASRYLQDDRPGYEARRAAAHKIHPRYGDFYVEVSEHAVKQHRYQEAIDLLTGALKLEPENERALVALGTGYLRMGREKEGLEQLTRAWERDPFNVMNYNLLTLFEKVIPRDYETVAAGPFRFRMNKKERPVLERYVPPLLQQAWESFCKRYGHTPKTPIMVELFTERQHYSVRTIGLPDLGAQGTCFGELITAMSPGSGEANWEQVLWHELSHVFAIQLSNNRVPRWFTEGLSEYETNIVRPEWRREHNRELYLSLQRGDLWSIGELNAAFTRPDRPNGVVIAYHQSSLVLHYLIDKHGFEKILAALKLYGQGKRDDEVLRAITGQPMAEVDRGFRAWLAERLAPYRGKFLVDWQQFADAEKWKKLAAEKTEDAATQAAYAGALYVMKDYPAARAQAEKAAQLDADQPLARYILAQVAMEAKEFDRARAELESLLAKGHDSYGIRLALGQIAAQAANVEQAMQHLGAAKRLDPDRGEPYSLLADLYKELGRDGDAARELLEYTRIEEHEHDPARLLFDRLVSMGNQEGILDLGPRLIAIQPLEYYVHEHYGRVLAAKERHAEAAREFEAALECKPRKPAPIRVALARAYLAQGEKEKAREAAEDALTDEPGNPEATQLLEELG